MCDNCEFSAANKPSEITRQQVADWIIALRTGGYGQTSGKLYSAEGNPSYCCLGVYGVLNGGTTNSGLYDNLEINGERYRSNLPHRMMTNLAQDFFAHLNDGHNLSFKQIAVIVEGMPIEAFRTDDWWSDNHWFQRSVDLALRAATDK